MVLILPPKPKYTREQIASAAFELVRKNGVQALTARELGKAIGTSSSPIFTFFKDMDELKNAVFILAKQRFEEYMAVAEEFYPAYKKRGLQWIRFASEEPKLFQWMFMLSPTNTGIDDAIKQLQFSKQRDIAIIMRDYNASAEDAEKLFHHMWIYTYGLCVLMTTGTCSFTEDEQTVLLGEQFGAIIGMLTDKRPPLPIVVPEMATSETAAELRKISPDLGKKISGKE